MRPKERAAVFIPGMLRAAIHGKIPAGNAGGTQDGFRFLLMLIFEIQEKAGDHFCLLHLFFREKGGEQ